MFVRQRIILIPFVITQEFCSSPFAKILFKIAIENDIVFTMITDPALIAVVGMMLLNLTTGIAIKDFVE